MKHAWKFVLWTITNPATTFTKPPVAAIPADEPPPSEFKGIEVVEVKNKATGESQFAVKIHVLQCFKPLMQWMKKYNVLQTVKEWAAQVDWKNEVWMPLKQWARDVDWKQVRSEVKQGMDEVDWNQVRKDVKDDLKDVDWKQVHKEMKEGISEVDWKDVRQQLRDGMNEVDWKQVKQEVNEVVDWEAVKGGITEICPEVLKDEQGNVEWSKVKENATELCPTELPSDLADDLAGATRNARQFCQEEFDCEQIWSSVEEAFHGQNEMQPKNDDDDYIFVE